MESTILSSRFDWTGSDKHSFVEWSGLEQDSPKIIHQIPEEIGSGWVQSMLLPLNQVIRWGNVTFRPEVSGRVFPFTKMTEHFKEPVLCFQITKTGRIILSDHNLEQDFIVAPDASLFQHFDYRNSSAKLVADEDLEYFILIIGDSVLNELCGEEYAESLLKRLHLSLMPSASVTKVPLHINALLYTSVSHHLTGNFAKLHTQSKVLDYLCGLYKYYAHGVKEPQSTRNILYILHDIHNDLIHMQGKVPSLDELSKQYGISAKQLSIEFKKKYGKSLFSYFAEVRLNEALAALQKTDTPMKTIARNLGYSHVNHFINAFNRQFGYSPGSLRKLRNDSTIQSKIQRPNNFDYNNCSVDKK
ncbi:MAG: helix-turn-helix transcriptional regulator [Chlorobium sp.]|nr:MAG: helix-turn-helix transcriptional regulator [Chlorobium sp.]